jgi:hypothetical protein
MEDRRDFIKLLTMLGMMFGAGESAEAAFIELGAPKNLQRPIRSRVVVREHNKTTNLDSHYMVVELIGANNTKQVFTSIASKAGTLTALHMIIDSHEDASNPTPTNTQTYR